MIRWGGQHQPGSTRLFWEETATIAAAVYSSSATANEEEGAGSSRRTWQRLACARPPALVSSGSKPLYTRSVPTRPASLPQRRYVLRERSRRPTKVVAAVMLRAALKSPMTSARGTEQCAGIAIRALCQPTPDCGCSRLAGEDRRSANDEPQRRRTKQPFLTQQPAA